MQEPVAVLKEKREKSALLRHPWVFSGAIASISPEAGDGGVISVRASDGRFLGRAFLNRRSQITLRIVSFDEREQIDDDFWQGRLMQALGRRAQWGAGGLREGSAFRIINAEADGFPGLIADVYGKWVVVEVLCMGMETIKRTIGAHLASLPGVSGVFERSDADVREKEGLARVTGVLAGGEPPERVSLTETTAAGSEIGFLADLRSGHKTGFYLDQAVNRRVCGGLASGRRVLNLFSYTGGFAIHCLTGQATEVVDVDSSAEALSIGRCNLELNGLDPRRYRQVQADVFQYLRVLEKGGERFDMVIVDPPKLAFSTQQVDRAARAYKDLNLRACRLLNPGGLLAAFSCSGRVSAELFQKIIFGAGLDAGADLRVIERLGQPSDHPVLLSFPEGEYLKGLLCRVN